jgi:hypothetical protein
MKMNENEQAHSGRSCQVAKSIVDNLTLCAHPTFEKGLMHRIAIAVDEAYREGANAAKSHAKKILLDAGLFIDMI